MKLRSYHMDSVETAIRMAGIELGDEAIFLWSRRAADAGPLLFTKLDETETYGAALNEAFRTRWPLSFFANGTRVREDLAPVSASLLSQLLLRRSPMAVE